PQSREDVDYGTLGVHGQRHMPWDPGQSLLLLPADWLEFKLHRFFPQLGNWNFRVLLICWLVFVPVNVAMVLACYWLLRLFRFDARIAGLTSVLMLIGTTELAYAQVAFQNSQLLLLVTVAYAAAVTWMRNDQSRYVLLSGAAIGTAVLIRTTAVIHALTVGLFLL